MEETTGKMDVDRYFREMINPLIIRYYVIISGTKLPLLACKTEWRSTVALINAQSSPWALSSFLYVCILLCRYSKLEVNSLIV